MNWATGNETTLTDTSLIWPAYTTLCLGTLSALVAWDLTRCVWVDCPIRVERHIRRLNVLLGFTIPLVSLGVVSHVFMHKPHLPLWVCVIAVGIAAVTFLIGTLAAFNTVQAPREITKQHESVPALDMSTALD